MSPSDARLQFLLAAHRLSVAAPASWQEFLAALEELSVSKCKEAVVAPNENAHVCRGYARAYMDLAHTFKTLDDQVKKIKH